ncbi:hypothetical protein EV200_103438 [Pedobacter psychrotolerans]|uniref:Uncharacterized protein n=1 Tax=Pedobacter psychrotolerans TaxID=1843235 RepID=A0A4R2HGD5_9SPHI|nr:hypothetical protein [Pedobacter psychrotolerans]TCO27104.1 hypothetical protein EV200_103438 [Pedobacter psychrotolerans]GGE58913.1 hypothetical protein GCM10011413_26760 [Pedobacter psychrotolerans]
MPEEYRKVVFDAYQKKKREGSLSSNLLDPTPGNVREECLIIYRERERNPKDDEIFKQFFKGVDKEKGYLTVIENSLAEKFKQMPKILKGSVPNYGLRYAELLAWLIDFQPRPSTSYYTSFYKEKPLDIEEVIDIAGVKIDETLTTITGGNDDGKQNPKNEKPNKDKGENKQEDIIEEVKQPVGTTDIGVTEQPIEIIEEETTKVDYIKTEYVRLFSPRYITISCILLLFIGTTSFAVWERSATTVKMPSKGEGCMYWNEDHYEPVKCDTQIANATIIPLNLKKLQRQRKINLTDTLTSYSLGKVWYKGFVKNHEFFTDSGAYPQDTQRVLKPLSSTILTKYTSNYRYMLTRLVWFVCAAFFIGVCGFAVSKLEKEVITKDESEQQDSEAVLPLEEEPIIEQTEGSLAM